MQTKSYYSLKYLGITEGKIGVLTKRFQFKNPDDIPRNKLYEYKRTSLKAIIPLKRAPINFSSSNLNNFPHEQLDEDKVKKIPQFKHSNRIQKKSKQKLIRAKKPDMESISKTLNIIQSGI